MVEPRQKIENSELHWFWELTTKGWFFPVFYVSLVLFLSLVHAYIDKEWSLFVFLQFLYLMPSGLGVLLNLLNINFKEDTYFKVLYVWPLIFHLITLISIIAIVYFKQKKSIIIKWLIITLLLLMILSFVGCVGLMTGFIRD
ncbi:MAG: hypothetical protein AABX33_08535 [Nanoarchaeota archaeon]